LPTIEIMKGLNCYALFSAPGGPKKSLIETRGIDGFFGPGGPDDLQLRPFIRKAAGVFRSGSSEFLPDTVASAAFLLAFVERT